MFIGRNFELSEMNKLYIKDGFQLVFIYGREKVGKTSLIREFCKDKPTMFYCAAKNNEYIALSSLIKLINSYFNITSYEKPITSWEDAFSTICEMSNNKKLILVLDEFPYIARVNPAIPSILKKLIDHKLKYSQIFLIISGPLSWFIEEELLSSVSPLYSLRSAEFKIEPFDFYDCSLFFNDLNTIDKIKLYATLGGIPQYILQFDYSSSYDYNMMEFLLKRSSYLFNEPDVFIKSEFKNARMANYLLSLLSRGSFNLDQLSEEDVLNYNDFHTTLKKLNDLNLVSRNKSIGKSSSRPRSFYKLDDNFFRFWYRFIYKNRNLVDMQMSYFLYENKIMTDLNSHIGYIFEDICMQFLKRKNSKYELPFVFETIGSWLGYNSLKRRPAQIDIVAHSDEKVLIGECKWTRDKIHINILYDLMEKGAMLEYCEKYYCLFSKSGFTKELLDFAHESKNIYLYSVNDL